jgi:rod shape-determining protein MreB
MQFSFLSKLTKRIGIDLGSTKVRMWSDQDGVFVDEPACIAIDRKLQKVLAVGKEAQEMMGRMGQDVQVVFPIEAGIITDQEVASVMLRLFLRRALKSLYFFRPIYMVSVGAHFTQTERDEVVKIFYALGAHEVYLVDQCLAAAIGAGVPIADASGTFLVQLGGGVVEAGIISFGSLVAAQTLLEAGKALDRKIQIAIKKQHKLQIGSQTAQKLKHSLGSVEAELNKELLVTGQDLITAVPREVTITASTLHPVLSEYAEHCAALVKKLFAQVPSELTSDVIDKGMLLSGGLAQLHGLDHFFTARLGVLATVVEDPEQAVIRGLEQILQNLELFKESVGYYQG